MVKTLSLLSAMLCYAVLCCAVCSDMLCSDMLCLQCVFRRDRRHMVKRSTASGWLWLQVVGPPGNPASHHQEGRHKCRPL